MAQTIGVVLSTQGRESLRRTLHSVKYEQRLIPGDEMYVMGDGPVPYAQALCAEYGWPFKYVETKRVGCWGHPQLNLGTRLVSADVVVYQDDDDVFLPGAFDAIRRTPITVPTFFRFQRSGIIYPSGNTRDGHCLVVPNVREKVAPFEPHYGGDQDYMTHTLERWEQKCEHRPEVLALAKPEEIAAPWPLWKLWGWRVQNDDQVEVLRQIRNECRNEMTHARDEISQEQQRTWWNRLDQSAHAAYLYTVGDNRDYVAFSFVAWREGKPYVSYGMRACARGRRLSYDMVQQALWACQGTAYADVWETNGVILKVDFACGYEEVGRHDGLVDIVHPWP